VLQIEATVPSIPPITIPEPAVSPTTASKLVFGLNVSFAVSTLRVLPVPPPSVNTRLKFVSVAVVSVEETVVAAAAVPQKFPTKQLVAHITVPLILAEAQRSAPVTVPDTHTIGPQMEVVAHRLAPLLTPDETIRGPQIEVVAHRLTPLTKPLPQTVPEKVLTPATV
jgi:hypothetical protein